MASVQQKRPSISNWFSSLRRQPKNKKAASLYGADKQIQRSCIDLSLTNSAFYMATGVAVTEAGKQTQHQQQHNQKQPSGTLHSGSTTVASSIDNLQEEDDQRGLVTGTRVSQLCSRCCCNFVPLARSQASPTPPTPPLSPLKILANANDNDSDSRTFTESPSSPASPASATTPIHLSSQTTIETDVSRNVHVTRVPSTESDADTTTILMNKRSELVRKTTTTTTRTLIISRPVELVLNERGEVVGRRSHFEKKLRSNSLGCVLDEDDSIGEDTDSCASAHSPRAAVLDERLSGDGGGGEFRFIDDSSTSQSENERNSQNKDQRRPSSDRDSGNVTLRSPGDGEQSCNGNNNNNDLCDVCKNVIRRNYRNNAVIMRNNKQIKDELCEVVSEMEALDVPEDCKHSNKDKQMSIGRKKFNMDPKKGIEYLVENRLLRHDPQDVAHFLYKGEGLNKTAIGDYLGEKNDFNEDVLKAFVALHDFTNLILVQALRQFLWSFRLPGEAQKIDRMMECFAQRYCQLNPDIFTNTDTCYVLSFAIIMLNTSLHNPSVKDKPTVEQFISMNRGINNGGDLPRGLLESLYESIRTEPFKIPQDDGNDLMHTFFNPDKEGWLWKQGGRYKSWKRRWFILNDNCLYYFEYTTDKEPRGIIPLENISVREIHDRSKPHCFELFATGGADIIKACKTDSEGKVVEGKHTVYRMSAATEEDQQEWIKRLTQSISHNPFYDILVQRKKKALSKS